MRIRRMLFSCLVAVPLVLGAVGCDKIAQKIQQKAVEKAVEAKSGGEVKLDLGGKTISGVSKNGKQVTALGEGVSMPADFPKQVPIYPGASLTMSHADNSGPPKYALVFNVAEEPDKVVAYYKNELKGFKQDDSGANVMLNAETLR
jgi:hypothetical protein